RALGGRGLRFPRRGGGCHHHRGRSDRWSIALRQGAGGHRPARGKHPSIRAGRIRRCDEGRQRRGERHAAALRRRNHRGLHHRPAPGAAPFCDRWHGRQPRIHGRESGPHARHQTLMNRRLMKHAKNLTRIARNSVSSLDTEVRSRIKEKKARLAPKPGAPRPVRPGIRDLDATGVLSIEDHGTDIPLHWYEVGPSGDSAAEAGDAEPLTIVFIHGFTLGADSWYRQFRGLRKELPGVRLLTLDQRGHGKTGAVPPSSCSTDTAAEDVLAVVAERAPAGKLILVGPSLGGQIAFAALRHAAEDVRQRIAGVVQVSSAIDRFAANGIPELLNLRIVGCLAGLLKASPKRVRKLRDKIAGLIAPALAIAVFSRPTNRQVIDLHAYMINETPLDTYLGFLDDLRGHDEYDAV